MSTSPLPAGLAGVLSTIVDALLDRTLSYDTDYGILRFRDYLGSQEANEQVLRFLQERVGRLTDGRQTVRMADRIYIIDISQSAIAFALVHTAGDEQPVYFSIGAGASSVRFCQPRSEEAVAQIRVSRRRRARREAQEEIGRARLERLTDIVCRRARARLEAADAEARTDVRNYLRVSEEYAHTLDSRLNRLELRDLLAILAILGDDTLPQFA
jgi:regulator of protease activity HflC (stomatin/prohibitin superfamily)